MKTNLFWLKLESPMHRSKSDEHSSLPDDNLSTWGPMPERLINTSWATTATICSTYRLHICFPMRATAYTILLTLAFIVNLYLDYELVATNKKQAHLTDSSQNLHSRLEDYCMSLFNSSQCKRADCSKHSLETTTLEFCRSRRNQSLWQLKRAYIIRHQILHHSWNGTSLVLWEMVVSVWDRRKGSSRCQWSTSCIVCQHYAMQWQEEQIIVIKGITITASIICGNGRCAPQMQPWNLATLQNVISPLKGPEQHIYVKIGIPRTTFTKAIGRSGLPNWTWQRDSEYPGFLL